MLSSCEDRGNERADADWWRLEADRIELESEVKLLKHRLSKHSKGAEFDLHLAAESEANATALESLNLVVMDLRRDIAEVTLEAEAFRAAATKQRRLAMVGRKLDELVGVGGRIYKDVEFTSVSDAGLTIRHSSGIARLVAEELTLAQQEEFGIDAEGSRAAIALERERALAYQQQVARHLEKERTKAEIAESRQKAQTLASIRRRSSPSRSYTSTVARTNPLHEPPRRVGRSSSTYRSYYRSGSRYRYYYPNTSSRTPRFTPGSLGESSRNRAGTPRTPNFPSTPSTPAPCPND
ncbi:MAG: hypothetical protein AAGI48_04495 [Verrucomicrobiota bacterium]